MKLLSIEGKGLSSFVFDPPRPGVLVLRAGGGIAQAAAVLEQHGCRHPFEDVGGFIGPADLAFGSLEMSICSKVWPYGNTRARGAEHEVWVLALQAHEVGWPHGLKRLSKIPWRHVSYCLGTWW